jgi:hypothetical protein
MLLIASIRVGMRECSLHGASQRCLQPPPHTPMRGLLHVIEMREWGHRQDGDGEHAGLHRRRGWFVSRRCSCVLQWWRDAGDPCGRITDRSAAPWVRGRWTPSDTTHSLTEVCIWGLCMCVCRCPAGLCWPCSSTWCWRQTRLWALRPSTEQGEASSALWSREGMEEAFYRWRVSTTPDTLLRAVVCVASCGFLLPTARGWRVLFDWFSSDAFLSCSCCTFFFLVRPGWMS